RRAIISPLGSCPPGCGTGPPRTMNPRAARQARIARGARDETRLRGATPPDQSFDAPPHPAMMTSSVAAVSASNLGDVGRAAAPVAGRLHQACQRRNVEASAPQLPTLTSAAASHDLD